MYHEVFVLLMSLLNPLNAGLLYIALAAVPALIAVVAWRNRDTPGATALVVTGAGASAASVIQGFRFIVELVSVGAFLPALLHAGLLAAINIAVLGTLYIAVEFTGQSRPQNRWLVAILVVLAVALPTIRIWTETAGLAGEALAADADFFYRFFVALAAFGMLGRQLVEARGVYRKQGLALVIGLTIGFGLGLVERFITLEFVEFTLIGMTAGSAILAWALFRYGLLETVPVARETLFDHLSDPVIALGGTGHIADLNQAAIDAFGVTGDIVGSDSGELFQPNWELAEEYANTLGSTAGVSGVVQGTRRHFDPDDELLAAIRTGDGLDDEVGEIGIATDGVVRYYHVTSSTLSLGETHSGHLLVFRDVTAERNRAADLDTLKQVLTRVLRHNLRNEVTVIRGFASTIAETGDPEIRSQAERIVNRAEKLTETSETARRIESVIDADEHQEFHLPALIEQTLDAVRSDHPAAELSATVPDFSVRANPEFDTALLEIVTNAVIHSDADQPRVEISGERIDQGVELRISDNGPGIPEHELETLTQGEETSLTHGSGAGLWLIQTTIDSSNGDVRFESDDKGTTVRIRLPELTDTP